MNKHKKYYSVKALFIATEKISRYCAFILYVYDTDRSRLNSTTDALGNTTSNAYDAMGRLTQSERERVGAVRLRGGPAEHHHPQRRNKHGVPLRLHHGRIDGERDGGK